MHYVIVADAKRARIFGSGPRLDHFDEVVDLFDPTSGMRASDLVSDQEGKGFASGRELGKEQAAGFARVVAERLRADLDASRYERLIVAAPPTFLGMLRKALSPRVAHRVVAELGRDWTLVPVHDLPETVRAALPETAGMP